MIEVIKSLSPGALFFFGMVFLILLFIFFYCINGLINLKRESIKSINHTKIEEVIVSGKEPINVNELLLELQIIERQAKHSLYQAELSFYNLRSINTRLKFGGFDKKSK